jgi:hypothetical protein
MLSFSAQWFFYGDRKLVAGFFALLIGVLFVLSVAILFRVSTALTVANAQLRVLDENYKMASAQIRNDIIDRPSILASESIEGIHHSFELVLIREEGELYFAGSNANILKFLIRLLSEGYDVREFRLTVNHYKSLLVIPQ